MSGAGYDVNFGYPAIRQKILCLEDPQKSQRKACGKHHLSVLIHQRSSEVRKVELERAAAGVIMELSQALLVHLAVRCPTVA